MSTITKEFTKEQLQQIIETDHVQCGEASALARIALASLESVAAPVVPDEMTPKQASRSYCGEVRGYRDGWNACRAAMLQGSEPETDNTNQQFESLSRGVK